MGSAVVDQVRPGDGGEKIENGNEENLDPNINEILRDDDLQAVLSKLKLYYDRDACALVCKRWKAIQDRGRSMRLRAGPLLLERVAARFSNLTDLDMSESAGRSFYPGWKDTDLGLVTRSFGRLERLNLNGCKGITDKGLTEIGLKLPKLQWLDVSDCKLLTDAGVEKVASECHGLRALYLSRCKLITDKAVAALSQCRFLETLVLQGCTKVGDDGLLKLSQGCASLQVLDLTKCAQVGDLGVKSIVNANSATLHTLILEDCPQVGDTGVIAAAECCQSLQTLLLGGCRLLSDLALDAHFKRHTSLTTLQVEHCMNLTDDGIRSIFSLSSENFIYELGGWSGEKQRLWTGVSVYEEPCDAFNLTSSLYILHLRERKFHFLSLLLIGCFFPTVCPFVSFRIHGFYKKIYSIYTYGSQQTPFKPLSPVHTCIDSIDMINASRTKGTLSPKQLYTHWVNPNQQCEQW